MEKELLYQRALSALYGVAVGDAFGKMTEGYWPSEVIQMYGEYPKDFKKPIDTRRSNKWSYAEITDDTTFTKIVAESIVCCGNVNEEDIVKRILDNPIKGWPGWDEFNKEVKQKKRSLRTGNGAPMRVAPLGIIHSTSNLEALILDVEKACGCTHNTRAALSASCAISAAFSAAIENRDKEDIINIAIKAAELGRELGKEDFNPDVARRLQWVKNAIQLHKYNLWELRYKGLNPGYQAWEGASFAIALVGLFDSPKDALFAVVQHGGDSDSIASMACGILSAKYLNTLPSDWILTVKRVNGIDFNEFTEKLIQLRA